VGSSYFEVGVGQTVIKLCSKQSELETDTRPHIDLAFARTAFSDVYAPAHTEEMRIVAAAAGTNV